MEQTSVKGLPSSTVWLAQLDKYETSKPVVVGVVV